MADRHFCWTLNNPEDWIFDESDERVRYCVYQEEKGSCTHFQGYTELDTPMRWTQFNKEFLDGRGYARPRMGSRAQARNYCMKTDDTVISEPIEFGTWNSKGQGNRSDHDTVAQSIREVGLETTICEFPGHYIRFHGGMEKLHNHWSMNKVRKITVSYGKFKEGMFVIQTWAGQDCKDWFTGYGGQDTIFIPGGVRFSNLEREYPMWVGKRWAEYTKIVIEESVTK